MMATILVSFASMFDRKLVKPSDFCMATLQDEDMACRQHQSSAIESATSPFATALSFSKAPALPKPAAPDADTPRFATLGRSDHRSRAQSPDQRRSSHHADRSSFAHPSSFLAQPRSSQAHMLSASSVNDPAASPERSHGSMLEPFSDVHMGRSYHAGSGQNPGHSRLGLRQPPYSQDADSVLPARASSSSPFNRAFPGSPYRSPAHAAAVSAVEQQLHTSLHRPSVQTDSARAAPHSPAPFQQSAPGMSAEDRYQRWTGYSKADDWPVERQSSHGQHVHASGLRHADTAVEPGPVFRPSDTVAQSSLLLRPLSQQLNPSPELDSLSQRLREQKLSMARQGQSGNSLLAGRPVYSPSKGYTTNSPSRGCGAHSPLADRPADSPARGYTANSSLADRSTYSPAKGYAAPRNDSVGLGLYGTYRQPARTGAASSR